MVEIKGLSFSYGQRKILNNVSFTVQPRECVAILGTNGAGKSTLAACIDRILLPSSGSVFIDGRELAKMSRRQMAQHVAYVAQDSRPNHITVLDSVLLGRRPYIQWNATADDYNVVDSAIQAVGLENFRLRLVDELSGGEMQKVMLARAIAQEPKLMLLDEPTSNLDPRNQYESMDLIRHCAHDHGIAVLVVIHDLNLALRFCDRFLFLKDGAVLQYGGLESISEALLEEVYRMKMCLYQADGSTVVFPAMPKEHSFQERHSREYTSASVCITREHMQRTSMNAEPIMADRIGKPAPSYPGNL